MPFTTVIVSDEEGAAKLQALTGKQAAPVLQVGEKQVVTGFNSSRWHSVLDDAGYPKTAPSRGRLRHVRRAAPMPAPARANAAAPATDSAPPRAAHTRHRLPQVGHSAGT